MRIIFLLLAMGAMGLWGCSSAPQMSEADILAQMQIDARRVPSADYIKWYAKFRAECYDETGQYLSACETGAQVKVSVAEYSRAHCVSTAPLEDVFAPQTAQCEYAALFEFEDGRRVERAGSPCFSWEAWHDEIAHGRRWARQTCLQAVSPNGAR